MDTSWKPTNPCKDCTLELREALGRENVYGFDNECQCEDQRHYNHETYAVERVLGYLTQFTISSGRSIPYSKIQSMLKELQEEK